MDDEVLASGSKFAMMKEEKMDYKHKEKEGKFYGKRMAKRDYGEKEYYREANGYQPPQVNSGLDSFWASELQNFLKLQPLQVFNLKPDEKGEIIYKNSKLGSYSNLLIVVADSDSVASHCASLEEPADSKCPMRDLSLKKALD